MIMYVTGDCLPELACNIDYLGFTTPSGDIVTDCDTDDSKIKDGRIDVRMKGVYFNDEYANGMLSELSHATLSEVQLKNVNGELTRPLNSNTFRIHTITVNDGGTEWKMEIKNDYAVSVVD